jgi:hypothetical protein
MAAALVLWLAPAGLAQNAPRRLTTIDALRQFPRYFHLQNIVLRGEFVERDARLVFESDTSQILLLDGSLTRKGPVEVRGQMMDVGRLDPDDQRLAEYAKRRGGRDWPTAGAELVLNVTAVTEAQAATRPTVRSLALEPWKFEGQKVTIAGNFRGRNLFADLPDAPGKGRYDFVLGGAEGAAVWIVGMQPRGRGFDLNVDRRNDTNRWLEVTGVVGRLKGLVTVTATAIALTEPPPPVLTIEPESTGPSLPPQPAVVVFSAPTPDETDVPPNVVVRIQMSRGLKTESLADRVRVTYVGSEPSEAPPQFTTAYNAALSAVQITFRRPLDPFRTVKVELLQGITAFDGAPVTPWSLTFSVGR